MLLHRQLFAKLLDTQPGRLAAPPSARRTRDNQDRDALEQFPNASTGGPTRNALPSSSAAAVLVRRSWIARHGEGAGVPGRSTGGRGRGPGADASVDRPHRKATLRDGGPRSAGTFGASVERGISPKRRGGGLRCTRRCSSRSTVRCSRRRAITTRSTGRRGRAVRLGI